LSGKYSGEIFPETQTVNYFFTQAPQKDHFVVFFMEEILSVL